VLSKLGGQGSEVRGLKQEVRSRRSEVGGLKSGVGGLKSEVGVNLAGKSEFHAEFLPFYYLFLEIQSIPHYDFHISLLTVIANFVIVELPAL